METFLVQVWVPADERSRGGDLRGVVRHVATGTETPFLGDEEVLDLLHGRPQTKEDDRRGQDRRRLRTEPGHPGTGAVVATDCG